MAEIVWLDPALDDLEEIVEFISLDNADAAENFATRVFGHVELLARHPKLGPVVPELPDRGYRQIIEPPCRIIYKIQRRKVFIVHVMRSERILRVGRLEDDE